MLLREARLGVRGALLRGGELRGEAGLALLHLGRVVAVLPFSAKQVRISGDMENKVKKASMHLYGVLGVAHPRTQMQTEGN